MPNRKACIVVDLRTGQHVANIPDLIAVLAAAGWKTDIALKVYGGETFQLAKDETEIFGIRVDDRTLILDRAGQQVSPAIVLELQEGEEIMVDGKKNKRYVMQANCLRFLR